MGYGAVMGMEGSAALPHVRLRAESAVVHELQVEIEVLALEQ